MDARNIKLISPIDGDMLHSSDGIVQNGVLFTQVKVSAAPNSHITVNGEKARLHDQIFIADLRLKEYQTEILIKDEVTGEQQTITVYWLKNFAGKYRLSIDDNIWFLQDLTEHAQQYNSLFDNDYLHFLRDVHDTYGTKVHINIFYQTEGFNLSQMTDKYKEEWKRNADWIRLSFHAMQEFPDKPYINAGYHEVKRDCDTIMNEIRRFAGEELMGAVTTIHWGEATVEGSRAMRDAGYKGQLGYFNVDDDLYPASYYLTVEERRHVKKRFIWKDNREDIIFVKTSIVIDTKKLPEILPYLNLYIQENRKPPYVDLLVHEQYFYPHYFNYQPDFREKIVTAVKWAADNGYAPAFLTDCILDEDQKS